MIAATESRRRSLPLWPNLDYRLMGVCLTLLAIGVIMVGSASISTAADNLGNPLYFMERQAVYAVLGLAGAAVALRIPLAHWQSASGLLLVLAYILLLAVLIPGVGKTVNGSTRWIPLGVFNLQVSEPAKLFVLMYLSAWLVRRPTQLRQRWMGLLLPMAVMGLAAVLLLAEPDFGAAVVLAASGMAMLFLAGAPLLRFLLLMGGLVGIGTLLIVLEPYRLERLSGFLNPWADPFDSGFQLTQSLIAIGRGEWFGVGLGGSVQKLFYLPEAHTDFVFAVLAEEFGLLGVCVIIALYGWLFWRAMRIGSHSLRQGRPFGAYLAYGIGIWLGLQALINMGVNMGLLPTKGLTLPLMSYGGSSLLVTCAALALLLRCDYESRLAGQSALRGGKVPA
ncbi:putative lipid II flippase FtsW [Alkalilimnicola sp. S0819]|uniref:putative lipid II flippase FtsW n=1 Tax=Alkalilimnicola sp. S0819 TaxID=2613922 RepID=UPI001261D264|nr:putative lipid II flippase FtsW [Alkalilimnicola sp. S0819]KAB7623855.1 putative lipid II flippase FtsW [Alkalilimnicola sp. S0819]MPQ16732.1 putative lipid II flippase FtsW [Alkalilimnicola sp. S0819]